MRQYTLLSVLALWAALVASNPAIASAEPDASATPASQQATETASDSSAASKSKQSRKGERPHVEIRINANALRARLTRSIEKAESLARVHRSALTKLDEGGSPAEVLAEMKIQLNARNTMSEHRNPESRQSQGTPRREGERFSPKERKQLHTFLRNNFPDLWENFQPMIQMSPQGADRLLARMAPQIREIVLLEESQPDLAKLKIEEMRAGLLFVDASGKYKAVMKDPDSSGAERALAQTKLREAAAMRFDVQLSVKQFEVKRLESRLKELQHSVGQLETRREVEIEKMVNASSSRPVARRGDGARKEKAKTKQRSRND